MATDPYFDDVQLLLHMDGADGSSVITDSSSFARTTDDTTIKGTRALSTANAMYGTASCGFFDGVTSGISYTNLDFSASVITTMECVFKVTTVNGNHQGICKDGNNNTTLYVDSTGQVEAYLGGTKYVSGVYVTAGTEYHIAVVRNSAGYKVYLDGVLFGTKASSLGNLTATESVIIGTGNSAFGILHLDGYVDEFRLTTDVERYTSNFTVPAMPFGDVPSYTINGSTLITALPSAVVNKQTNRTSDITYAFSPSAVTHNYTLYSLVSNTPVNSTVDGFFSPIYTRRVATAGLTINATVNTTFAFTRAPVTVNLDLPAPIISDARGGLGVNVTLDPPTITATGTMGRTGNASLLYPAIQFNAVSGAYASFGAPELSYQLTGTTNLSASAQLKAPQSTLNATGTTWLGATASLNGPSAQLTAYSGAVSQLSLAAPILTTSVTAYVPGYAEIASRFNLSLLASGVTGITGSAIITAPVTQSRYAICEIAFPNLHLVAGDTLQLNNTLAYTLNLSNQAVTTYDNYDFAYIVRLGDSHYGVKADGLYELTGDTDAGSVINAKFRTEPTDFGTALMKRVANIYIDNGDSTMVYPVVDGIIKEGVRAQFSGRRSHLARGNRGRYWAFEVSNTEGSDMVISGIEFTPDILTRRV